ncbi:hypothetical protein BDZ94DRAFT_92555 [Collybia nuda]|uniref:Uncharacterized protein n=1 Tax=Collybia nuda TaxID=64659 RepID=A0A9P5YCW3_9AGAR|nr:hypothetical protein BDZ94DRAFT_92555 [Collybia nuda]
MFKAPSLLAKRSLIHLTRPSASLQWRHSSTSGGRRAPRRTNRPILVASGAVMLALGLSPWYMTQIHADAAMDSETESDDAGVSLGALVRSYAVYTMCSIPALVDYSPKLLELGSLPGLKWITEALVRVTFFDQVSRSSFSLRRWSYRISSSVETLRRRPSHFYTPCAQRTKAPCLPTPSRSMKQRQLQPLPSSRSTPHTSG